MYKNYKDLLFLQIWEIRSLQTRNQSLVSIKEKEPVMTGYFGQACCKLRYNLGI